MQGEYNTPADLPDSGSIRLLVLLSYPLPLGEEGSLVVAPGGRLYRLELWRSASGSRVRFGPETEMARYLGVRGRWEIREEDPFPGLLPAPGRRLAFWLAANCLAFRPLAPARLIELLSGSEAEASLLAAALLGGAVRARKTPGGMEVKFHPLPSSLASFRVSLSGEATPGDRLLWPPRSRFDPSTLSRAWNVPPPRPFAWGSRKAILHRGEGGEIPLRPGPPARVILTAGPSGCMASRKGGENSPGR